MSASRWYRCGILRPATVGMGQPRRPARLRHRDVTGVPADAVPAEGRSATRRSAPACPSPCWAPGRCSAALLGPRMIACGRRAPRADRRPPAQAVATVPLIFLGLGSGWMRCCCAATFVGGVANLVAIVGFMVTATSGVPDTEQGPGHRAGHDEPADRDHAGHPGHVGDRRPPGSTRWVRPAPLTFSAASRLPSPSTLRCAWWRRPRSGCSFARGPRRSRHPRGGRACNALACIRQ